MIAERMIHEKREYYQSKLVEVEKELVVNPNSERLLKDKERFESQKMKCIKELRDIIIDKVLKHK